MAGAHVETHMWGVDRGVHAETGLVFLERVLMSAKWALKPAVKTVQLLGKFEALHGVGGYLLVARYILQASPQR